MSIRPNNERQSMYTPMRALLRCRWQNPEGDYDHSVVELNPDDYARVEVRHLVNDQFARDDDLKPEWIGEQDAFIHPSLRKDRAITFCGNVACHVMAPVDPSIYANVIVSVSEANEDFRVVRISPSRLLLARALVDYISPTEQREDYIKLLAGITEKPRSDTYM